MDAIDIIEKDICKSNVEINDIRLPNQFKNTSFSGFKKTDVKNQLILNINKGKLEPACYWCAELITAGHYMDIWETCIHYIGKYIHLGNPKIVIYIQMRFEMFREIVKESSVINEINLRNNSNIRKLFAEIISTLTLSPKKHSFESIKINRVEEFDMTQMSERLKATGIKYAETIMKHEDPRELYIAINEFSYNISKDAHNTIEACYWVEWIIEFDSICKKRKEPCLCEKRSKMPVENKYQRDIIWILWDSLFNYCEVLDNPFISKLMMSILEIFCIKYTTAACRKRRYLLYFAVALLTEPVPTNVDLNSNKQMVQNIIMKIDEIYKQIKKNEHSPKTDYLFKNIENQYNIELSIRKMELVNSLDTMNRLPT